MKHIILGTAGHVDHGKTSLIKALTGIDTDRLKEEKERGITIELGFASLKLPDGQMIGIVDVPGHERFIKNMVAGAAGIDILALVIAADEGVMPQTREHLAICSLLGITRGVIALTKIDMVEPAWLELITEDIRTFTEGTFLENAPIVPVSAVTGTGLPEFVHTLGEIARETIAKKDAGLFRLPVDRVFTIKGFGTVVTGTLVSGSISSGEEIEILPPVMKARIRGLQVHNESVDEAESGQRTAINLQGIDKAAIDRGDILARPGTLQPTNRLDVTLQCLEANAKALKHRQLIRFHAGTSEIIARVTFFDRTVAEPGEQAYAQLFLEKPIAVVAQDHFVIRSYSPVTTIGGGIILDPLARKHRRRDADALAEFQDLHLGTDDARVNAILRRAGINGIRLSELVLRTGVAQNVMRRIMETMWGKRIAILIDTDEQRSVASALFGQLQDTILIKLREHHEKNPLKEGMIKEELRNAAGPYILPKVFSAAARDLEKSGRIIVEREMIRLPDHSVNLEGELDELRNALIELFRQADLAPPTLREVTERFPKQVKQVGKVLQVMIKENLLVKVSEDLYYDRERLEKLREEYRAMLLRDGKASPVTFKEMTGLTRKFIIPLMEYFDMTKLTIRTGDFRVLRAPKSS